MSEVKADPQTRAGSTPFQGDDATSGPSRERMDGPGALTFARLRAVNVERCARWHPGFPDDGKWSGADWSNAAAGEMGEACNVVKKLRRQETGGRGAVDPEYAVLLDKLADEIADTVTYLDLLAAFYGIAPRDGDVNDLLPGAPCAGVRTGADWSNVAFAAMGTVCAAVEWPGFTPKERLIPAIQMTLSRLGHLAAFYGIDMAAAVIAKFDRVSVREGLPERLGPDPEPTPEPEPPKVVDLMEALEASLAGAKAARVTS